jgi:hypothetical protein
VRARQTPSKSPWIHAPPQLLRDLVKGNGPVGLEDLGHHGGLPGQLPEHLARLRVPELQSQPQAGDPIPDQLDTGRLKLVDHGLVEVCEPWSQHIAAAKCRTDPLRPLILQDAAECTVCRTYAEQVLLGICPNCGEGSCAVPSAPQ